MAKDKILLYGATGFMGRLVAEKAVALKFSLVLAGRSATKLAELDRQLTEEARREGITRPPAVQRAFPIETPGERVARLKLESQTGPGIRAEIPARPNREIDAALSDVAVIINAAAPFSDTADALARACVRTKTHYTDICGEYDIFADLIDLSEDARRAQCAIVPGVGLTVLVSDLLVELAVKRAKTAGLGAPHVVRIALSRVPAISRGSAKTMLDSVRNGVIVGRHGTFESVPVAQMTRSFVFGEEKQPHVDELRICTAMTLADLRSAPRTAVLSWGTSGISALPSVETYVEASAFERFSYQLAGELALPLRSWPLNAVLDKLLEFWPEGPPKEQRAEGRQQVVVEVEDRYRRAVHARVDLPNSYDFSANAALLLAGALVTPQGLNGFLTPAQVAAPIAPKIFAGCRVNIRYRGVVGAHEETLSGGT